MRTNRTGWVALAVAIVAGLIGAREVRAQSAPPAPPPPPVTAQCLVFEVQASKEGTTVDAELKPVEKKLRDVGKWTSFKLLGKQEITAVHRKPASATLKSGGKLTVVLKDKVGEGKKPRLRLNVEALSKDGTQVFDSTYVADNGDYAVFQDDDYILALGCTAK